MPLNYDRADRLADMLAKGGHEAETARGIIEKLSDENHESIEDILRHDKGHDDWHAAHGDPPCKSEADCARMRAKYDDDDGAGVVQKYDADQARDDHGRFAGGGSGEIGGERTMRDIAGARAKDPGNSANDAGSRANKLSDKADSSGNSDHHIAAANAHSDAAEKHASAAEHYAQSGNASLASEHAIAAGDHAALADHHVSEASDARGSAAHREAADRAWDAGNTASDVDEHIIY